MTRLLLFFLSVSLLPATLAQQGEPAPDYYQQGQFESLLSAADSLAVDGQLADAENRFLEALQISKANFGFDSLHQLPALAGVIRMQRRQRQWESMNRLLEYHNWVVLQNRVDSLETYLSGLSQLGDLHLQAAGDAANPNTALHLITAKNLNWRAVTALENEYGREDERLIPWLYRIVLAHFHQSALINRRGMTSYNYKTDSPGIVAGWSLSKIESVEKSHGIGQELLARITGIRAASDETWSEAIATVYQGDWELLFGNQRQAMVHYRQALSLLQTAGTSWEAIDVFFDRTVVLPATTPPGFTPTNEQAPSEFIAWSDEFPGVQRPPLQTRDPMNESDVAVAQFRFGLLPNTDNDEPAAVSSVSVDSIEPDNPLARQLALRYFSQLQFRPRFVGGQQREAQAMLTYRFPPQAADSKKPAVAAN